jgi:hypothetical protein
VIKNLTPHPLTFLAEDGETVLTTIPPSGVIPRVREEHAPDGTVPLGGVEIPVSKIRYTEPEGLPAQEDGVFLVVSLITAQAAPGRTDLLIPTGQVRGEGGRIIGCTGLGRL